MDPKYSLDAVLNMLDTVEEVDEEIEIATTPVEEVIANSINIILNSQSSCNENNDVTEYDNENLDDDPNDETYIPDTTSESDEDFSCSENLNYGNKIDHEEEKISDTNNVTSESHPAKADPSNTERQSRKRKRDPSLWRSTVRHRKRVSGESYITRKGKSVEAKTPVHVNCNTCRYKCSEKFTEHKREQICRYYYNLADVTRQKDFIVKNVMMLNVERRRSRKNTNNKRSKSCVYYFHDEGKKFRVCKNFFMATLCISSTFITQTLLNIDDSGGYCGVDKRIGKQPPTTTDEVTVEQVKEHIQSFPTVESHYCRKNTKANYLDSNLSVSKMYSLYINDFCKEKNVTKPVKEHKYREIFMNRFNLRFFKPKKDQCTTCNSYYAAVGSNKQELAENWNNHKTRETESLEEKAADKAKAKADDSFKSVSFDLQAVLNCPHAGDAQIFYKRKLSLYNFTIYDAATSDGYSYLWDETQGQRGSSEIGTALLKYIDSLEDRVKHLSTFSDTCSGQNRNQFVCVAMLYTVQKNQHLETIDLKYMESGHSFMEVDSMHSLIERASKHQALYTPSEWEVLIRNCRRSPRPYTVQQLDFNSFYDLKDLAQKLIRNRTKSEKGEKINWLNIKWLRFQKSQPNVIQFKYRITAPEFEILRVIPKTNARNNIYQNIILEKSYNSELPITNAKKADLLSLLQNRVIPQRYEHYFSSLKVTKRPLNVSYDDDDESE